MCLLSRRRRLPTPSLCFKGVGDLSLSGLAVSLAANTLFKLVPDSDIPFALMLGCEMVAMVRDSPRRFPYSFFHV